MQDPMGRFERLVQKLSRQELGQVITEYIIEANHSSWDGFESEELVGVKALLQDLVLYVEHHDGIVVGDLYTGARWFRVNGEE